MEETAKNEVSHKFLEFQGCRSCICKIFNIDPEGKSGFKQKNPLFVHITGTFVRLLSFSEVLATVEGYFFDLRPSITSINHLFEKDFSPFQEKNLIYINYEDI